MYLLEIEPLDLGADVRAVGLELVEADENREPVRGTTPRASGAAFCVPSPATSHGRSISSAISIACAIIATVTKLPFAKRASARIVVPAPEAAALEALLDRFQKETFGARAGRLLVDAGDPALEGELRAAAWTLITRLFATIFSAPFAHFEDGSLVLLSEKLWASEVIRRVRPVLDDLKVEVRLPA